MCKLFRWKTRRSLRAIKRQNKTILELLEKLVMSSEALLEKVAALETNAVDTANGINAVAASLAETKTELEALRELLADAEGNAAAIAEANARLEALVGTTQANEDALAGLVAAPPVE